MPSRRFTQWVLLCALVFAVVGMHHVAAAETPHAMHTTTHQQDPNEHDALHLCVAVLVAAVLLFLVWFLLKTALPRLAVLTTMRPLSVPQRPPPGGRSLLTTLCVLRN